MKPLSRQRRYQFKHERLGLCIKCPRKAATKKLCLPCAVAAREGMRRRQGCKGKRQSLTRRLEAAK